MSLRSEACYSIYAAAIELFPAVTKSFPLLQIDTFDCRV